MGDKVTPLFRNEANQLRPCVLAFNIGYSRNPFSSEKKKGYKSNSITRPLKLTGPWSRGQADKGNFKKDISLVHII